MSFIKQNPQEPIIVKKVASTVVRYGTSKVEVGLYSWSNGTTSAVLAVRTDFGGQHPGELDVQFEARILRLSAQELRAAADALEAKRMELVAAEAQ